MTIERESLWSYFNYINLFYDNMCFLTLKFSKLEVAYCAMRMKHKKEKEGKKKKEKKTENFDNKHLLVF